MARYYLHFSNENEELRDAEGFNARDEIAAHRLALRAAGQLLASEIEMGRSEVRFLLCLDDEHGRRMATIPVIASASVLIAA